MKRLLTIIVIGLSVSAFFIFLDERTKLTIFQPNGFIKSGTVFGISIGEDPNSARKKLQRKKIIFYETNIGGTCAFRRLHADVRIDYYLVNSWHGGNVCIVSKQERIYEIIWAFQPVDL